jgi:hypothetical protein
MKKILLGCMGILLVSATAVANAEGVTVKAPQESASEVQSAPERGAELLRSLCAQYEGAAIKPQEQGAAGTEVKLALAQGCDGVRKIEKGESRLGPIT